MTASSIETLLVRIGTRVYAIPLAHVVEVMRPLPVERLPELPDFLLGVSVIRGQAVPVLDLARLMADATAGSTGRYVLVAAGDRRVALAVEAVPGLTALAPARLEAMPPLLGQANAERIQAVGRLDEQLLMVLDVARLVEDAAPVVAEAP